MNFGCHLLTFTCLNRGNCGCCSLCRGSSAGRWWNHGRGRPTETSTAAPAFCAGYPARHLRHQWRGHQLVAWDDTVDPPPTRRRLVLSCQRSLILDQAGYVLVGCCRQVDWVGFQSDTHAGRQPCSAPKVATGSKMKRESPAFSPSPDTMLLQAVAAPIRMSSKSSSMKLMMWPSSLQHGRFKNLGMGSRHYLTASPAASSMGRTAPKRFFSTHSGATSRQHEMWYLPGSVWKAGMLIFDEKTVEQIFIQPRHIILPSVLRIRILIYRFIVHTVQL